MLGPQGLQSVHATSCTTRSLKGCSQVLVPYVGRPCTSYSVQATGQQQLRSEQSVQARWQPNGSSPHRTPPSSSNSRNSHRHYKSQNQLERHEQIACDVDPSEEDVGGGDGQQQHQAVGGGAADAATATLRPTSLDSRDGEVQAEQYDSLGYEQQLVVLRQMLTPDKVAQIRAISTPEEQLQLDLVLQDMHMLEQMESSAGAQACSDLQAPTTPAMLTPAPRRRSTRHTNVATRLAQEQRQRYSAEVSQPCISAEFYSYLQSEVFQGANGEEMREILETLGHEQLEQLASVFDEMRAFVHQPPEKLAQKYSELSRHMDTLMAATPEEQAAAAPEQQHPAPSDASSQGPPSWAAEPLRASLQPQLPRWRQQEEHGALGRRSAAAAGLSLGAPSGALRSRTWGGGVQGGPVHAAAGIGGDRDPWAEEEEEGEGEQEGGISAAAAAAAAAAVEDMGVQAVHMQQQQQQQQQQSQGPGLQGGDAEQGKGRPPARGRGRGFLQPPKGGQVDGGRAATRQQVGAVEDGRGGGSGSQAQELVVEEAVPAGRRRLQAARPRGPLFPRKGGSA